MTDRRCLLPVCHGGGEDKKIAEVGIRKLISCAIYRGDGDLHDTLQDILDGGGDAPCIVCHSGCYCTYTSKEKIERLKKAKKRKAEDDVMKVTTRSYTAVADNGMFEFKRDCLFCGDECVPMDDRHPERWDRVRECMTKERFDKYGTRLPTMKDVILDVAEQRNDDVASRIKLHLACVSDLPSADCKFASTMYAVITGL